MSTAGASILAIGYLLPLIYLLGSLRYGKLPAPNPWDATGLEWQTPSPPPKTQFRGTPVVTGAAVRLRWPTRRGSRRSDGGSAAVPHARAAARGAELGMWIFLATEVMLFGGLFTGVHGLSHRLSGRIRRRQPAPGPAVGGVNTVVLLVSSLTMALAVQQRPVGGARKVFWYLVATALLGVVFMVIKGAEYYQHFLEGMVPGVNWTYAGPNAGAVQMFFIAYFTMTGLHSIHLLVAIVIVAIMAFRIPRRTSVEMVGLYWHFVDIVWTFLFPLLYLLGLGSAS